MRMASYRSIRVPNLSIRILRDVLKESGLDHLAPFQASSLDPSIADVTGALVSGQQEVDFQLSFIDLTRDRKDLWARAGRRYTLGSLGLQGWAIATSPTFADWMKFSDELDGAYSFAQSTSVHNASGELVGLEITYPDVPGDLVDFSVYRDVISILQGISLLTVEKRPPVSRIEIPLAHVPREVSEMVSAPIEVSSPAVRVEWDPALSTTPLPFGDAFQHATYVQKALVSAERFRLERDWPQRVVDILKSAPAMMTDLNGVAATLNASPRTLQRRLESEGVSFSLLRDRARHELAGDLLLKSNTSIAEISRILGYEESTSFSVAFRRWSGRSPSEYRAYPSGRRR